MPASKKNEKEQKPTMSQSLFRACALILLSVVALWLAVHLLAQLWGWLVLLAVVVAVIWVAVALVRARRDRW